MNSSSYEKLPVLFKALDFAARKHKNQKRKGAFGIPYINHPIEVANYLVQHLKTPDTDVLVAAILHDTVEDTTATAQEIESEFGPKVKELVLEVSDDMSLPSAKRKRLQVEHALKLSDDARAIKIADKTCNVNDILFTRIKWTRSRKIRYIRWAIRVIDQIGDTHPVLYEGFNQAISNAEKVLKENFRTTTP